MPKIVCNDRKFKKFHFMFERLQDKADILDEIILDLGEQLVRQHNLPEPTDPTVRHAELFTAFGRICCDANGRLNSTSVLLESAQSFSCGKSIAMDLSQLDAYSLFPGQIVAVEGINLDGKKLVVKKLYTDVSPEKPDYEPSFSKEDGPLQIIVAAGPFTQTDTLMYQPLEDLVSYIKEQEPHALILVGPFVDAKHPCIEEGKLAETFDSLFEKILSGIMEPLKGSHIQVVIVPSWRDVHHQVIYPTPPFPTNKYTNLHMMADPCQFSISGVTFGVTSVDTLFHLGKEEISFPAQGSDRLGRLASHVISQRSFYPLFPPAEELSVDMGHWEACAQISVLPQILILPSDLRYFIKETENQEHTSQKCATSTKDIFRVPTKRKRNLSAEKAKMEFMQVCQHALQFTSETTELEAVGINVRRKLEKMDSIQTAYAESLIQSVLSKGLLNQLAELFVKPTKLFYIRAITITTLMIQPVLHVQD